MSDPWERGCSEWEGGHVVPVDGGPDPGRLPSLTRLSLLRSPPGPGLVDSIPPTPPTPPTHPPTSPPTYSFQPGRVGRRESGVCESGVEWRGEERRGRVG